ncbi:MAG TPA: hypothetical protein VH280_01425 [Verrucomicrobiae bacterium]|nr:hypothetical protein [Verrucomicrobiae bacterium]
MPRHDFGNFTTIYYGTMQSTFSTSTTATASGRGGMGNRVVSSLIYRASHRNAQGPHSRQTAARKTRATRKGDLAEVRPPLRWGINE